VAVARDGEVLGAERFGAGASHLVELGAALERVMAAHRLGRDDLDRVAVVSGPGSFTGLRIGMAFAKGLHAGLGVEVVTMGTLTLMALPFLESYPSVLPMLDARKREVYAAMFTPPADETPPFAAATVVVAPRAMKAAAFLELLPSPPGLVVGSGAERYRDDVVRLVPGARLAEPLTQAPPVEHLARIGERLEALSPEAVRSLEPDYIRSSEAELKRLRETGP
jgi:tRNA threonylcarbamoyladenosine biosynthesis protein TsaB